MDSYTITDQSAVVSLTTNQKLPLFW